ncbi:MAG TPA: PAS domain S-box protein [Candidatus Pelethocola excrementipullorum]|nr:PAS domain S-box protein [Candidatus Pelethocola excrementipullorum]
MKRKIFKNASLLVVLAVVFTFVAMNIIMYEKTLSEMKTSVRTECRYMKSVLDQLGETYLTSEIGDITPSRLTLINQEGKVLFETMEPADMMTDHGDRPEFRDALEYGTGSDLRSSRTFNEQVYYYAMRLEDGNVIRVARNTDTVLRSMETGFLLIVGLLGIFGTLAVILVNKTAKRLIEPINRLNLEQPLESVVYEELSPLLLRIDQQNKQIREQMMRQKQNQEEYLAITEYMKDGLVVTNRKVVLSINRAAQKLFDVTQEECVNHDIITVSRNEEVKAAFEAALSGEGDERVVDIQGRTYQLLANPVRAGKAKVTGVVILILDITEKQQAENMRREFSANVSHELKTPLMSISGYAEIIENGLVKSGDIQNFAGRIHDEASRLTTLVEDIIKLSRLDENDDHLPMEEVDLLDVAQDVESRLGLKAEEANIQLKIQGETAVITGVYQVLYEMIYNLCDNAIKYNSPGGFVCIFIEKSPGGRVEVKVQDDGIGITNEDQGRIFERFYRVDKSHSRETGGTGLGLSIVKHGAILHDAKITLESALGRGTTISILFQDASGG